MELIGLVLLGFELLGLELLGLELLGLGYCVWSYWFGVTGLALLAWRGSYLVLRIWFLALLY